MLRVTILSPSILTRPIKMSLLLMTLCRLLMKNVLKKRLGYWKRNVKKSFLVQDGVGLCHIEILKLNIDTAPANVTVCAMSIETAVRTSTKPALKNWTSFMKIFIKIPF